MLVLSFTLIKLAILSICILSSFEIKALDVSVSSRAQDTTLFVYACRFVDKFSIGDASFRLKIRHLLVIGSIFICIRDC